MHTSHAIQVYNAPLQLLEVVRSLTTAFPGWPRGLDAVLVIDCSDQPEHIEAYAEICRERGFVHVSDGTNHGISGGRVLAARRFLDGGSERLLTQGDGMLWEPPGGERCRFGFYRHFPDLVPKAAAIAEREGLDLLKLSFCEEYGTNAHYYTYHALRDDERRRFYPETYAGTPHTALTHIDEFQGLPYAVGDVPYSNWPSLWSRRFAWQLIANTPSPPDEQSWMRQAFRRHLSGAWRYGVLLASPVRYRHVHDYDRTTRREHR